VLLCENQEGYGNLIKAGLHGYWRASITTGIDLDCWPATQGLIGLSRCLRGQIPETLPSDKHEDARRLAHTYAEFWGRRTSFWK